MKRYSLNVTKEVYLALMKMRTDALAKTGHAPTVDELLRKQFKLEEASNKEKIQ
jgi:hypothetical protein